MALQGHLPLVCVCVMDQVCPRFFIQCCFFFSNVRPNLHLYWMKSFFMGSVKDEPPEAVAEEDRGSQKSERGSAKSGSAKSAPAFTRATAKRPLWPVRRPTVSEGVLKVTSRVQFQLMRHFVSGADISTTGFGELQLSASLAQSLVECWQAFLRSTHTPRGCWRVRVRCCSRGRTHCPRSF